MVQSISKTDSATRIKVLGKRRKIIISSSEFVRHSSFLGFRVLLRDSVSF